MLLLVVASLLWSVSFALIDQSGIDADLLAAARLGLAALLFAPVLARSRVAPRRALALMGVGALQFGVMYVLVMRSYAHLAGHEVALLTITTPILVVLSGAVFARSASARPGLRPWVAASVAVAAAYALSSGRGLDAEPGFWTGVGLVQAANLAWAAGQVLYARIESPSGAGAARRFGWLYVGAALVAGSWASGTVGSADLDLTGTQLLKLLYLGLVPSGLAFYLWNRGATQVRVGTLAVMNNLKVPLAVAVALAPPFNESADLVRLTLSAALLGLALWISRPGDERSSSA